MTSPPIQASRLSFWSAILGHFFEHYDIALFGFLSPFLAPLIFPGEDPIVALIFTYAMIPLGMLARPIGSLVFGYIGDRYGRREALFLTLAGMGVISTCIAFTPTYAEGGLAIPILFCLGRLLQNFFSAGETMGGAIFLLERVKEEHRDLFSSLYNAATVGGILVASAGVSLLYATGTIAWGWRALYLAGAVTALFGCLLRLRRDAGDMPAPSSKKPSLSLSSLGTTLWACRRPFLLIALSAGFGYANYTMALVLMNGFIPLVSSLTKADMMSLNTFLLAFDFACLPLCGYLASKTSRKKVMVGSALAIAVLAIPLSLLLQEASWAMVIAIRASFVLLGVAFFAPFHAWARDLVPAEHRYMVISFGYAVGAQLLGGPTAAISLWLFNQTDMVSSIAWYWVLLASLTGWSLARVLLPGHRPVTLLDRVPLSLGDKRSQEV